MKIILNEWFLFYFYYIDDNWYMLNFSHLIKNAIKLVFFILIKYYLYVKICRKYY